GPCWHAEGPRGAACGVQAAREQRPTAPTGARERVDDVGKPAREDESGQGTHGREVERGASSSSVAAAKGRRVGGRARTQDDARVPAGGATTSEPVAPAP